MAQKIARQDLVHSSDLQSAPVAGKETAIFSARIWLTILVGLVVGLLVALFWQASIADESIGFTVAGTILPGSTAHGWTVANVGIGVIFAIAAGLGTTFTACNCVVFSCIAPLTSTKGQARLSMGRILLWMALGVICVTAVYGIVGAFLDKQMPSLSTATLPIGSPHLPVRLLQSSVVFVCLGLLLFYAGLTVLQVAQNPFRKLVAQRPWLVPLSLGVMVGFFTVGRPFPLFRTLFQYSAGTGNPFLGGLLIALQGLCNIAVMALLFVLLTWGTRGFIERWMQANPFRAKVLIAVSVIGGGTFLIAYWGLRLYAQFGIGWFPHFA